MQYTLSEAPSEKHEICQKIKHKSEIQTVL